MTIEALEAEKQALLDFKEWLEDKLLAVEIDLAGNEMEANELLDDMEDKLR